MLIFKETRLPLKEGGFLFVYDAVIVDITTCQWADLPLDELCKLARSMGYDGLEIACWGNNLDLDRALTDESYIPWVKLQGAGGSHHRAVRRRRAGPEAE